MMSKRKAMKEYEEGKEEVNGRNRKIRMSKRERGK